MSDPRQKLVILRKDLGINWEQVYREFERRFIEDHYEQWRRTFNMDACNCITQRCDRFVGEIVACWLPGGSVEPDPIKIQRQRIRTYYD